MTRPTDTPDLPSCDAAEENSATSDSPVRYEGHEGETSSTPSDVTMSYGRQNKPGGSSIASRPSASSLAPGKGSSVASSYARIQRKATGAAIADGAEQSLDRARQSSGAPLPADLSGDLGNALGTDLSGVRVHDDSASHEGARSIGAKAYTEGQNIHFGAGQYDPSSSSGKQLLAHETAHTVQQQGASPSIQGKQEISSPGDTHEREADGFSDAFVAGRGSGAEGYSFVSLSRPAVSIGSVSGGIHRAKDPDANFDGLDNGEQQRLFRAASVQQQVVYLSRVSRPQRRYTLFTSLEPSQQARLIPAASREDRSALVNKLPVGDTAGWFRNRQLDTYQQYLVYLSMTDLMRMELISELAGRVGSLFKALSVRERSEMISLIPATFIGNFFESYPGDIADLYSSVPSDMKAYVFAMMPLDMQNAVAIGTASDESKSTSKTKPEKKAEETAEPAKAPSSTDESFSAALVHGNAALGVIPGLTTMYTAAVDSLHVKVLLDLGQAIAGQVESARATHTRMSAQAHGDDEHASAAKAFGERLTAAEATVANAVGANRFRGRSIAGRSQNKLPANEVAAHITEQTAAVMELLETVIEIKQLLGDEPDEASDAARQRAVSKIELWRSNFLHFQFLRKVLTDEGYFASLRDAKGESGTKLEDTAEEVVDDWRRRGEPKKKGDPWYVQLGRAVEAGVKYVIPDFEDLPELTLRTNLALIMWDVSGAIVEGIGDATGLFDYEQDGQSTLGETAEPIARHPTRMYDGVVEALAEQLVRIENGDPEAIGETVAVLLSLLVPGAEDALIGHIAKFADDLGRATKQLAKVGFKKTAGIVTKHQDEVRKAVEKIHGSGGGVDAATTGTKKPDGSGKSPGVAPDGSAKTTDGSTNDAARVESANVPQGAEAELEGIVDQLNRGEDASGKALSGKAKARLRKRRNELKEQLGQQAPDVDSAPRETPTEFRKRKSGLSGKEAADDVPSWIDELPGPRPGVNESGKEFAARMMDGKYGAGGWAMSGGQRDEYSQLQKFADRAFE